MTSTHQHINNINIIIIIVMYYHYYYHDNDDIHTVIFIIHIFTIIIIIIIIYLVFSLLSSLSVEKIWPSSSPSLSSPFKHVASLCLQTSSFRLKLVSSLAIYFRLKLPYDGHNGQVRWRFDGVAGIRRSASILCL